MGTKPLMVEYLIILKQEDTFCNTDTAFLNFLAVDSSIKISTKDNKVSVKLKKTKDISLDFTLVSDLVPAKEERFFKFSLYCEDHGKINEFNDASTLLENIIRKLHPEISINVLWNDIARLYAIEGYTLINEVENLLRRLIANFMLTKVGYEYPKSHIPNEVESRDSNLKVNYSDYLHQTYFSDLKTILFEGQREVNFRTIGDIQLLVERHMSERKHEIKIDDITGVISKSLWEKHFAKDTTYKKKDLEQDLENLNSLRNEIAHNRHVSRETLGKIEHLSKRIITILKLEIDDLPNKKLTTKEIDFQQNNENNRIFELNPILREMLIEKAIYEWYVESFGEATVYKVDFDYGIDLLVREKDGSTGVIIKSISAGNFREMRNEIAHGLNLENHIPKISDQYDKLHLVIAIRDFNPRVEMKFAEELRSLFQGLNPKLILMVGMINDGGTFIRLY